MGCYAGFPISVLGIFVYRFSYFGLYDTFGCFVRNSSFLKKFCFGYSITIAAGLLSYPLDTIRRRQMITSETIIDATKHQVAPGGWTSLFDGAMINIVRGLIAAFYLVSFEKVTDRFRPRRQNNPPPST